MKLNIQRWMNKNSAPVCIKLDEYPPKTTNMSAMFAPEKSPGTEGVRLVRVPAVKSDLTR